MKKNAQMSCEIVVWYVLPVLRSEIAKALVKQGKSQREVAKLLGLTDAAISQYLKDKRGKAEWLDAEVHKMIQQAAKRVAKGEPVPLEICKICNALKGSNKCGI
jgi:predicted transcriptional regulator